MSGHVTSHLKLNLALCTAELIAYD